MKIAINTRVFMNTAGLNTRRPLWARLICSSPGPMDSNARALNAELRKVVDEVTGRLECAVRDTVAAAVTRYQHSLNDPRTPAGMPTPEKFEAAICNAVFPNGDVDRADPRTTEDLGYAWDYIRADTLRRIGGR